jgi:hypothetical protein
MLEEDGVKTSINIRTAEDIRRLEEAIQEAEDSGKDYAEIDGHKVDLDVARNDPGGITSSRTVRKCEASRGKAHVDHRGKHRITGIFRGGRSRNSGGARSRYSRTGFGDRTEGLPATRGRPVARPARRELSRNHRGGRYGPGEDDPGSILLGDPRPFGGGCLRLHRRAEKLGRELDFGIPEVFPGRSASTGERYGASRFHTESVHPGVSASQSDVLFSYDTLRIRQLDLCALRWDVAILDEAQRIRRLEPWSQTQPRL